jgi:hypothetical protein
LPPLYPEHHTIGAPPVVVVLFHCRLTPIIHLHNDIHDDKLADPLLLSKHLISKKNILKFHNIIMNYQHVSNFSPQLLTFLKFWTNEAYEMKANLL